MKKVRLFSIMAFYTALVMNASISAQDGQPAKPVYPDIPGITVADERPNACVNCHKQRPEMKYDGRLSTMIKRLSSTGAGPELMNMARASVDNRKLSGKHPDVADKVKRSKVPDVCLECHHRNSRRAPPFARMMHLIHFSTKPEYTGDKNSFLASSGGYCTNCHVLNPDKGTVTVKSGKEAE